MELLIDIAQFSLTGSAVLTAGFIRAFFSPDPATVPGRRNQIIR